MDSGYCRKRYGHGHGQEEEEEERTEYGAYGGGNDYWNGIYEASTTTTTMVVESAMSSLAANYHQHQHHHQHHQYHHLHHHQQQQQNHHYHHQPPPSSLLDQQYSHHEQTIQPPPPQQSFQQATTEDNNLVWPSSAYDRCDFHPQHHQHHHHHHHNGYHSLHAANNVHHHHHPTTTTTTTTTVAAAVAAANPSPNGLIHGDQLTNRPLDQTDYGQCVSAAVHHPPPPHHHHQQQNLGNVEPARFHDGDAGRYYPLEPDQPNLVAEPFANGGHYGNMGGNPSANDVPCCANNNQDMYPDMSPTGHRTSYPYDPISNGYDLERYRAPTIYKAAGHHPFHHYPVQHTADAADSSGIQHASKMRLDVQMNMMETTVPGRSNNIDVQMQTRSSSSSSKYKLMTKLSEHITIKKHHNFTTDVYQIKHNSKICSKTTKTLFSETKHIRINRLTTSSINRKNPPNPRMAPVDRNSIAASPSTITMAKYNVCYICGKNYARPSTLKTHLRTHSGEKPYRCQMCNKAFSQAANLTAHTRIHSGEKPFPCPICQRRFSQSSSVTTHLRTHSGERPYCCRFCGKSFSDSSTLTKHLRIHSGEKPYQCPMCFLSFSQSGNLNRHMRIHI